MKTYMTRTCSANMTSFNGTFTWPESGPVECPDWDPKRECGNGLHGLLLGCGEGSLLDWFPDAKWLIVEIDREDIVDLGGKIKVPKGTVIFSGPRIEAIAKLEALAPECKTMPVVGAIRNTEGTGHAIAGYRGHAFVGSGGTATAGSWGSATAGDGGSATAGFKGKATAGDNGYALAGDEAMVMAGFKGTAIAGFEGIATAGKYGSATAGHHGTATAGDGGSATAGHGGTAMVGYYSTAIAGDYGTAIAHNHGVASAGENGKISIDWYDTKANRMRTTIGYVGEDGIKPNKAYKVDPATGTLVLVE